MAALIGAGSLVLNREQACDAMAQSKLVLSRPLPICWASDEGL